HEQLAALFQVPEAISHRFAILGRDQNAIDAPADIALVRGVIQEHAVHHPGAARVGEELTVIADQAARRTVEDDTGLAGAGWPHVDHLALAIGDLFDDDAG